MTVTTGAPENGAGRAAKNTLLLTLAVVALLAVLGGVLLGKHAVERHGTEAELIRHTCKNNGPDEVWQQKDYPDVFVWLVGLSDGRWGCWFVQNWPSKNDGAEYRERTAFCPADGSYNKVICYLKKFAERIE